MRTVWLTFLVAWVLLAVPGVKERLERPTLADASLPQTLSVIGTGALVWGARNAGGQTNIAAVAFVALALCAALATRLQMGSDWSPGVQEPSKIHTGGAFTWVPHPIYTSVSAAAVATALTARTPAAYVGAGLIVGSLAWKGSIERKALNQGREGVVVKLDDYR